jgi:hypothetical protein
MCARPAEPAGPTEVSSLRLRPAHRPGQSEGQQAAEGRKVGERPTASAASTPSQESSEPASAYCPSLRRASAGLPAAQSRSALSSASSHTRDHHAPASPVCIAPVSCCPHVWHSHHTFLPRPGCGCCTTAFSTRQPTCAGVGSARAARLDRRRVGVQANEAHALVRLNAGGGHWELG